MSSSPPASMQVLGPSTGGIRRHVATLTTALRDRGATAAVVGPEGVLGTEVPVDHALVVPGMGAIHRLPGARRHLRDAAGAEGARVIHAHGLKAAMASLGGALPVVMTVHNEVIPQTAGRAAPLLAAVERRLASKVHQVIAVSPGIAEGLADRVPADRLHVVVPVAPRPRPERTAEEIRTLHGIAPDAPLVVSAARLHPQKDLPLLFGAVADISATHPGLRVLVVGEGPQEEQLRSMASALGLGEVVHFGGRSPHAVDELAAADVVALSSAWEGSPIVAAEALQLGRPLVTTDVGDVATVVGNGEAGWLVEPGDRVGFAAALADALDHPAERERRGEEARRRSASIYEPEHLVDEVVEVYREALR